MNKVKSLKFMIISSVLVLLGSLFISADTLAQQYPPGNYKNSCTDLLKVGHMLEAKCRKEDGTWQSTVLFYGRCNGPIHNNNGQLTCNQRGGGGGNWLPPGNYQNSCRNMNVNGDILQAQCQRRDGTWRFTSIDYDECYDDISNRNGRLVCGQRHHHNMLPRGSYKQSCQDYSVNGDELQAQCQKRNGEWRWSSIDFGDCYGDIANHNGRLVCE
ncbi:MAG: CVNH domain-containing protein [Thermodesulfobacteriota bacterium]